MVGDGAPEGFSKVSNILPLKSMVQSTDIAEARRYLLV